MHQAICTQPVCAVHHVDRKLDKLAKRQSGLSTEERTSHRDDHSGEGWPAGMMEQSIL